MIPFTEAQEHGKLIYGNKNKNPGCLWTMGRRD